MIYELSMYLILNKVIIQMLKNRDPNTFLSEECFYKIHNEYINIKNKYLELKATSTDIRTIVIVDEMLKDINEILTEMDKIKKKKEK